MRLRLHPHAEEEVLEAARWYEDQVKGLGFDLLTEVDHWLTVLPETPMAWPRWPGARKADPPVRRAILRRFPFAIAYQVLDDEILVLAFAHSSRRPFYWSGRPGSNPQ